MKAKFSAMEIANFYVQLVTSISGDSIDNLKLNEILYYAQGWCLVLLGRPLFDDKIEAREYGPVIPEVYQVYKVCGRRPIEEPKSRFDEPSLSTEELNLLMDVYTNYGQYTGIALMNKNRDPETPWSCAFEDGKNREISQKDLAEHFSGKKETFERFRVEDLNIPLTSAVSLKWNSSEDSVYG